MAKIISAIDIGSNGIRMLLAEVISREYPHTTSSKITLREIKKTRSPIRLGKEVFLDQPISELTMQEALKTFQHFKNINQKYEVQKCRAIATSALREAKNSEEFIQKIQKQTGINIEIIDGFEEARLIHLAVNNTIDLSASAQVLIDIGGGSVEITFSEKGQLLDSKSFPMGTVRILDQLIKRNLSEDHLKVVIGDYITPIAKYISQIKSTMPLSFAIGTGGNLECMAKLKLELLNKTPNNFLTLNELVLLYDKVNDFTIAERVTKLHLKPDRADVILPAILIVKTIMRQCSVNKVLIPCVGLRNGILWSMAIE